MWVDWSIKRVLRDFSFPLLTQKLYSRIEESKHHSWKAQKDTDFFCFFSSWNGISKGLMFCAFFFYQLIFLPCQWLINNWKPSFVWSPQVIYFYSPSDSLWKTKLGPGRCYWVHLPGKVTMVVLCVQVLGPSIECYRSGFPNIHQIISKNERMDLKAWVRLSISVLELLLLRWLKNLSFTHFWIFIYLSFSCRHKAAVAQNCLKW